jgi:hypothetical protein
MISITVVELPYQATGYEMDKFKEEGKKIKREVRERTSGYLVGALGLVAGLAWNDAIRSLIDELFPLSKNSLLAKFVYAILITIVVVILSTYVVRLLRKEE